MSIASMIAIYFVLWWLCLFAVLPFGTRSQAESGEIIEGTEPGAPVMARLWPKLAATTVLAAVVLGLVMWGLSNPVLQEYWR